MVPGCVFRRTASPGTENSSFAAQRSRSIKKQLVRQPLGRDPAGCDAVGELLGFSMDLGSGEFQSNVS